MGYDKRVSRRKREEMKRQKRKRTIIGVFVMLVMVLGSVGFIATSFGGNSDPYGLGFDYVEQDGMLIAQTDSGDVPFYAFPQTTISVPAQVRSQLQEASQVQVVFNPSLQQDLPAYDLVRYDLNTYLSAPVSGGVTQPSSEYNLPVLSCQNATQDQPVIFFVNGTSPASITYNNSCITVSGSGQDIILARDALLYDYYQLA